MAIAKIKFNKALYMLPVGDHNGADLREFFGVKSTHDLYLKNDDDAGDDVFVDPGQRHIVKDGNKYYTVHKQIMGG